MNTVLFLLAGHSPGKASPQRGKRPKQWWGQSCLMVKAAARNPDSGQAFHCVCSIALFSAEQVVALLAELLSAVPAVRRATLLILSEYVPCNLLWQDAEALVKKFAERQ